MTKSKHGNPREFEKGQIRELKKALKQANQEIGQLKKLLGYGQNKTPNTRRQKEIDPDQCENCGKGTIKVADLGIRTITTCTLCPYRKVSKS